MTDLQSAITPTIADIWESVLGLAVAQVDDAVEPGFAAVAGCVHLTSDPPAAIVIECDEPFARLIASRMFGAPEDSLADADVYDAIGEMANMAAGNLKAALAISANVSLPIVTHGTGIATRLPNGNCAAQQGFRCGEAKFTVRVLEGPASA
ncbi:MAG: chemotaxis protein CheX [Gemmatimonadaceae bacterium]|nr:chemotaxis protein CheX [Gemmatimonadaceae bacterium]